MIETDRLLELIDQFAEAEGRMKWAPNKKLHFEVAVIKAIQTLSQVTLNEVIENLAALRDGDVRHRSVRPAIACSKTAPEKRKFPRRSREAGSRGRLAETASADRRTKALPRSGRPPAAVARSHDRGLAESRPTGRHAPSVDQDLDRIGPAARHRGPQSSCSDFAPDQKTVMESLARPANRSFLEALLKETDRNRLDGETKPRGRLAVDCTVRGNASRSRAGKSRPNDSLDSFQERSAYQEALEIFKGEIKSVTT